MKRKQQLSNRANRYAYAHEQSRMGQYEATVQAFSDGYRAAMRDMRKIVRECETENMWHPVHEAVKRMAYISNCVRVRTKQFLRPLR